ncbi:MAG: DNA damage-inducible protein D [Bacillota bacterium]
MPDLISNEYSSFESIKHISNDDSEFWFARELSQVLDYSKWSNFHKVILKSMLACKNSGFNVTDHFADVGKMIELGKGGLRKTQDYKLSRYGCYLIVQNGDPRKEVIALGQTYFAIQTQRQEVADYFNQLDEDNKRLVIRGDIKQWNMMLAEAAHNAGVITDEEYAKFQNSGYMGLYGGLKVEDIHKIKGLTEKQKILDFMGSEELAANLFRITQTESKLIRENIKSKDNANATHFEVGKTVRKAIGEIGGTMPEDLPTPQISITEIEREQLRKLKNSKRKLMLDE